MILTDDDREFVRLAIQHYRVFAEVSEKQGHTRTAGFMRSQEFYAERMLIRIDESLRAALEHEQP